MLLFDDFMETLKYGAQELAKNMCHGFEHEAKD